ncbi:MAG: hypothetical protein AAB430_02825 [Patescibacteria group bacterium]
MRSNKLPKQFHKFFWDINPVKLDTAKYHKYVIERLLNLGDLESVKWVKDTFGRQKIIDVVKTGREINRKTANFFQIIYNIPKKEILCFRRESQNKLSAIWPY